ncbi:prepilin-type N-terminal cleavage/methylation domain-containing protein [Keratinibaculum paraultunense]|uniref:Prepilin-type N-terminal cleavage/methylation domain-containing protein n=1 Tax=Keratinibaculum paraultunense TaxID=1278232 RepID=A0A4R3KYQ4_9FIRM|nr:prepilin-type N-terminal cleavage/methylation domain-containing protein [Keratinibaculum paraultunense]QQY80598.1 prepilin-type N-terminal cleavage/methylation domain-containing protein [Keratinibaculum paraultunense]TCS91328.1 prepilin-type N-terminal cleavage/methylation domain-containing protein [Keratinibaculum paraultunense]
MNNKGFTFIEILVGLFLLGLLTVTYYPIINTSIYNLQLSKNKMEMINIAESTIEQLKSFNYNKTKEDEYLFDMQTISLINELVNKKSHTISLPLNKNDNHWGYTCIIQKEEKLKNFWKIRVTVSSIQKEQKLENVTIEAFMALPSKKENKFN